MNPTTAADESASTFSVAEIKSILMDHMRKIADLEARFVSIPQKDRQTPQAEWRYKLEKQKITDSLFVYKGITKHQLAQQATLFQLEMDPEIKQLEVILQGRVKDAQVKQMQPEPLTVFESKLMDSEMEACGGIELQDTGFVSVDNCILMQRIAVRIVYKSMNQSDIQYLLKRRQLLQKKQMKEYAEIIANRQQFKDKKLQYVLAHTCLRLSIELHDFQKSMQLYMKDSLTRATFERATASAHDETKSELRDQNFPLLSLPDTLKYIRLIELQSALSKLQAQRQAKVMNIGGEQLVKMIGFSNYKNTDEMFLRYGVDEDQLNASFKDHGVQGLEEYSAIRREVDEKCAAYKDG